jgi:hypothetical protein
MVRLAWIASELGSATSFPKRNIIQQNPWADERPSVGYRLRCLSATLYALTPSDGYVYRTGKLPDGRQPGSNRRKRPAHPLIGDFPVR